MATRNSIIAIALLCIVAAAYLLSALVLPYSSPLRPRFVNSTPGEHLVSLTVSEAAGAPRWQGTWTMAAGSEQTLDEVVSGEGTFIFSVVVDRTRNATAEIHWGPGWQSPVIAIEQSEIRFFQGQASP